MVFKREVPTQKKNRLHHHGVGNVDLMMEFASIKQNIMTKSEWVRGHQNKNMKWKVILKLKNIKLSNTAKFNILCDHNATAAQGHMF
jgi:hypothetical protein